MKNIIIVALMLVALRPVGVLAQSKNLSSSFLSGDYDDTKISVDSASNSFTGVVISSMGNFSCTLFFSGKMIKNTEGKYPIKAYPFGLMDTTSYPGTLQFQNGKNGHNGRIAIQLSESGACQNIIDFKKGVIFPLDKAYPYHLFSMVKAKKAIAFTTNNATSPKKGYLVQGDLVTVLAEKDGFCNISYVKKPTYKAWVKKGDLVL